MINEHDMVETVEPVEEFGLPAGAHGAVIHIFQNGAAFDVEFPIFGSEYDTVIATLLASQVRPARGIGTPVLVPTQTR